MLKSIFKLLSIALIVAGISYLLFGKNLQVLLRDEATWRQVRFVCRALAKKQVTEEMLCTIPLPNIPAFVSHYSSLRDKDEEWYRKHNWLYYPQTQCQDGKIYLNLMDKKFVCNNEEAELVVGK